MSHPRGNGQNGGHFYSNITQPVKIYCSFVIDPANTNGLGVSSVKSNGYVENVFMHTTATPGSGVSGIVNPNPVAGYLFVQFKNNYKVALGADLISITPPLSGTPINVTTGTTVGLAYVINTLGTTTIDQWQKLGLPFGVTPAVGVSFIAKATTTATGTGTIEVQSAAGAVVTSLQIIGNVSLNTSFPIITYGGMWITAAFYEANAVAAPVTGSVIGVCFDFDASSVTIDGL